MSVRSTPSLPPHQKPSSYSPYGHKSAEREPIGATGFNGEFFSTVTGGYALGNGHRIYIPRLMRFLNPDALSPFRAGGINRYAYCLNDPINAQDPSGRSPFKTAHLKALEINRYKQNPISKKWETLDNNWAQDLPNEVAHADYLIEHNYAYITLVESPKGLSRLHNPKLKHKFVLTRDKKFFMGSYSGDDPSHPSIAKIGQWATGASTEVVSAGYISKDGEGFSLDNHSGHYRPLAEQLTPAKEHLEALGIAVNEIRDLPADRGYVANFRM